MKITTRIRVTKPDGKKAYRTHITKNVGIGDSIYINDKDGRAITIKFERTEPFSLRKFIKSLLKLKCRIKKEKL